MATQIRKLKYLPGTDAQENTGTNKNVFAKMNSKYIIYINRVDNKRETHTVIHF
jgi:hypothetical protein